MKKTLCNQKPFKWQGMNTRKKKKIAFRKTVTFSGRQDSITSLREWEATSIPLPYPSRMRRRREKPSSPSRFYLISWENISPACWEKESSQVSPLKCIHSDVNYHVVPSLGLPWWFSGKEFTCSAGDLHSISGLGRSPGEGNGNPLQYSCLENPMDRGASQATVHGVARVRHDLVTQWQQAAFYYNFRRQPHVCLHVCGSLSLLRHWMSLQGLPWDFMPSPPHPNNFRRRLPCCFIKRRPGLPWWFSSKESACQRRRHKYDPWSGKIPHTETQLSQCTTALEPVLQSPGATTTELSSHNYWSPQALEPVLHSKRSHCNEKPAYWS